MKTVPLYPNYFFDEMPKEELIQRIETGISSKHEVTRNKWKSVAMVKAVIQ